MCSLFHSPVRPAGDSALISALLADMAGRQQQTRGFYQTGAFPSTRVHLSRPGAVRQDNNIFFTGLIGLGLRQLRPYFRGADGVLCDSILARMQGAFAPYRNRAGRLTYNFWKTDPPQIFPEDRWLELLDRSHALPDDLDDTVIFLEAMGRHDDSVRVVKALMEAHAGSRRRAYRGYRRYRRREAYSTWFGKKMPVDYDISVLCNVLYWVCDNHFAFGHADSATIGLLRDMITRGLPVKDPAFASPHYARSPVVLYHIGRLLGTFSVPGLDSLRPLVVAQAQTVLAQTKDPLDQVLLRTTLLRLGARPEGGALRLDPDDPGFVFFDASFSDYLPNPFRRIFLHSPLLKYEFRCPAYNRFLLLEYLVLREGSWKPARPGV
ncbi:hypothetical protein [Dinghuibacter silviterrae]|uniref:hypothetical protein n=1 Tax=Dinghuibacter silviterrae TaxID=1539049 RepID=UPI0010645CD5|nr:hypothetical protein [Dinghuibacter silviterrae]